MSAVCRFTLTFGVGAPAELSRGTREGCRWELPGVTWEHSANTPRRERNPFIGPAPEDRLQPNTRKRFPVELPHNRMGGLAKQGAVHHWIYSNIPEISSSNTPRIEILMSRRLDLGTLKVRFLRLASTHHVIAPLSRRCESQDRLQTLPHVPRVKLSLAEAPLRANCSESVC